AGPAPRHHPPRLMIALTDFAIGRLFPRQKRGNTIQDCSAEEFEQRLNQHPPLQVLDGYADFCKLHVHANWTSTRCQAIPITAGNRHLLRSGYDARSPAELPVLTRWFEGVQAPVARYLIPILYSREQLHREGEKIRADWGVVGCLYTLLPEEIPMAPITMMRNALGVAEGGSGIALDRAAYQRSVDFWERHANWRDPQPGAPA
ncbi:MAG: DUF3228 family protein, partial [Nevskia sp.]|nr:DUF3228 family protein [Nevskia sp.]